MAWLGKTALTIAGVGFAGGGAALAGLSFMPPPKETCGEYLNKQGRKIITGDAEKWGTVLTKYKAEGEGLLINIGGQNKKELTNTELKKWCDENSKKEFTDLDNVIYQRVSAWCTEPKTIEKLSSKTPLNTEDGIGGRPNVSESQWEVKKGIYEKSDNKDLIKEIGVDEQETTEIVAGSTITTEKLRKWCKFSKDKHFKHEKDSRFLKYLKWCV